MFVIFIKAKKIQCVVVSVEVVLYELKSYNSDQTVIL